MPEFFVHAIDSEIMAKVTGQRLIDETSEH